MFYAQLRTKTKAEWKVMEVAKEAELQRKSQHIIGVIEQCSSGLSYNSPFQTPRNNIQFDRPRLMGYMTHSGGHHTSLQNVLNSEQVAVAGAFDDRSATALDLPHGNNGTVYRQGDCLAIMQYARLLQPYAERQEFCPQVGYQWPRGHIGRPINADLHIQYLWAPRTRKHALEILQKTNSVHYAIANTFDMPRSKLSYPYLIEGKMSSRLGTEVQLALLILILLNARMMDSHSETNNIVARNQKVPTSRDIHVLIIHIILPRDRILSTHSIPSQATKSPNLTFSQLTITSRLPDHTNTRQ
ncbi:uncharacterized protein MYCFIDRAFT_180410 [Pseudocercospora fijiensis CIRAD86]|uniref:Uncharacterized protein n=1 Tax=Pseudocercospora fijiensis (strain CIRAD86) TaxID=383855 RepID=M3AHT5_PSEFD|nr:uncharacterized protein MYCFIDRAFT_180410 [Pseudocercospora fijiensis CIRAD86]EME77077.1 hypothetical protein MYCFIDRAFT_180410 [Pseudocercospora fijiensis CIRAD86]